MSMCVDTCADGAIHTVCPLDWPCRGWTGYWSAGRPGKRSELTNNWPDSNERRNG